MKILIAKTVLSISLITYGFFLLCEYLRPGFVSFVFSAHLFLIPILVFGIWLSVIEKEDERNKNVSVIFQVLLGLLLMLVFWREGEVFGDMRIFMSLAGLLLPFVVVGGLKK
ncbi:hypothetical protein KJ673_00705 [Patescibacteria group bacterium]|nr:hypothetical protein [Patescibacteria group bacterium]MCG2687343.1 hypothetical protein [Candidatus Parcubacteria bacterium]